MTQPPEPSPFHRPTFVAMAAADRSNFMTKFIKTHTVAPEAIEHFNASSWLAPFLRDPLYETVPTFSRVLKPTGEDYFFSTTIRTERTIPHLISLKLKNLLVRESTQDAERSSSKDQKVYTTDAPEHPDCVFLISLGRGGLDGHPNVMHGGMLCAILDETMGLTVMLHHTAHAPNPNDRVSLYTVYLNTTYRAAVATPGDILVKAWVTRKEGRKFFSRGQICNRGGMVMTEAEGLWVESKKSPAEAAAAKL